MFAANRLVAPTTPSTRHVGDWGKPGSPASHSGPFLARAFRPGAGTQTRARAHGKDVSACALFSARYARGSVISTISADAVTATKTDHHAEAGFVHKRLASATIHSDLNKELTQFLATMIATQMGYDALN